jgi:hypothetical protein
MAFISLRHALVLAFIAPFAVVAACSGSGKGVSLADYDTSCTVASDCVAVAVDPTGCCDCPNGAINKADVAKYAAAAIAAEQQHPSCNIECLACLAPVPVCSNGTCTVSPGSISCGTAVCTGGEICVATSEGGASPQTTTYHCEPAPACGFSCACTLCTSDYACEGGYNGIVNCVLP